jgi:ATP-binding protein involved in chromosome partitioning
LSKRFGYDVPLLGEVPLDTRLRAGGDAGEPIVLAAPDTPPAQVLTEIATVLTAKGRGLAGMQLGLTPAGR